MTGLAAFCGGDADLFQTGPLSAYGGLTFALFFFFPLTLFARETLAFSLFGGGLLARLFLLALALLTRSVEIDPDQPIAHWLLARLYDMLGDEPNATRERALHERCRVDDNAKDEAVRLARERYPWADHAAEATVFYELRSDPSFISPHSTRVISCQPLMKPSGASK